MNNKFKVALIGCGVIAPNHINSLLSLENVEICALCDIDKAKALSIAERFSLNSAKIYTDYKVMLNEEKPTSVHIATPHYLHIEMAIYALSKGVNVFLEKPMCISVADITKLKDAEKNSTAKICICFQNRFTSPVIEAMRIINDDGGAKSAFMTVVWKRSEEYYKSAEWRGKWETEGGGVMINQAIHSLDLLTLFLGKPTSLIATKSNRHLRGIIEVEDTCEGMINFEGGGRATFYATTASPCDDYTNICITSKNHKVLINLPQLVVDGVEISFPDDGEFIGKRCYGNGHAKLIKLYYQAISNGEKMPVTISDAEYATRIINAAYNSNDMEIII